MNETTLYIAQTLDGFIADENHQIDFLNKYVDNPEVITSFNKFIDKVNVQIMGWNTFEGINKEVDQNWPYVTHTTYVFTSKKQKDTPYVKFINQDVVEFVKNLTNTQNNLNIWIVGGTKIIAPLVNADLIDNYVITTTEQLIGSGVKLFENTKNKNLKLLKVKKTKNLVWTYLIKNKKD